MVPGGIPARGLLASLDPREPENWSICQGQGRRQLSGGVLHRCGLRVWSELDAQKTRIFGQF